MEWSENIGMSGPSFFAPQNNRIPLLYMHLLFFSDVQNGAYLLHYKIPLFSGAKQEASHNVTGQPLKDIKRAWLEHLSFMHLEHFQ